MKEILFLNKKEGETPLECLGRFRRRNKKYKDVKMTYAGRLDPMASGLLLVLAGEKVKSKEKYSKLDKVYEFEVLFGFAADSHDVLGKITREIPKDIPKEELVRKIKNNLKYFRGRISQKLPAYSAKTWEQARAGSLRKRENREINIYKLNFTKLKSVSSKKLLQNIEGRVGKVTGDFRQKEVLRLWKKNLNKSISKSQNKFWVGKFKIKCGSGTYVRGIANSLSERLKIPALAYRIKRTQIGKYRLSE